MRRNYRHLVRAVAALGLAGAFVLVASAPAYAAASTLDVVGTTIYYTAGAGQSNHLVIDGSGDTYVFDEVGEPVVIQSSDRACYYPTPGDTSAMSCTAAGILTIVVYGYDLDDAVINWTDRTANLYGGDGTDWLHLGGRAGATGYADGGNGNDWIGSGPGYDTMVGGAGTDTASYDGDVVAIQASLVTNSGSRPNETDFYSGIENLAGGGGNDTLIGNDSVNSLWGGEATICLPWGCMIISGNDYIYGNGANDTLDGQGGNDVISGGAGNDTLWDGDGDDWLYGDAGNDTLIDVSGPGYDHANGGTGYDLCWAEVKTQCEN